MNNYQPDVLFEIRKTTSTSQQKVGQSQDQHSGFEAISLATYNRGISAELHSSSSTDTQSSSNVLIMTQQSDEASLKEVGYNPFALPRFLRHADGLCFIITSMVVFSVSITIALIVQIYVGTPQVSPHGGIVSSDTLCSKMGFELMTSATASSADVAVITALCLCVTHPHAAGIGGGGFAMIHDQKLVDRATVVFDFREVSPSSFSNKTTRSELFEGTSIDGISPSSSIAVPGVLKGLETLHKTYGRKPWKEIVDQVASVAEEGFKVSDELADAILSLNISAASEELKALVTNADGSKLVEGDTLKQPALAETLRAIAVNGTDALYSGVLGATLSNEMNNIEGVLTASDMSAYEVNVNYDVNETMFADSKLITAGPPSFGFALHAVMDTMSSYPTTAQTNVSEFLQVHRLTEVLKHSLALQTQLGDPSRNNYTAPAFFASQLNTSLGSWMKAKINDSEARSAEQYLSGYQPLLLGSTGQQYVSLIGHDGFAVVISLSIGSPFGSQIMSSGFILNNAMLDFSWSGRNSDTFGLQPSVANYLSGGVRPMSSLLPALTIPLMSKCGQYLLPGSTPGYLSLSAVAQTLLNSKNLDLSPSISHPRVHQQLVPDEVKIENSSAQGLAPFLVSKKHRINVVKKDTLGVVDIVQWLEEGVSVFVDERAGPDNVGFAFND